MTEPTIEQLTKKIDKLERKLTEYKNLLEHFMSATENKIMSFERDFNNSLAEIESEING